jgi:hypothetical protein
VAHSRRRAPCQTHLLSLTGQVSTHSRRLAQASRLKETTNERASTAGPLIIHRSPRPCHTNDLSNNPSRRPCQRQSRCDRALERRSGSGSCERISTCGFVQPPGSSPSPRLTHVGHIFCPTSGGYQRLKATSLKRTGWEHTRKNETPLIAAVVPRQVEPVQET